MDIYLLRYFDRFQVHFENGFATFHIGFVDANLAIETTRAQQGAVEHIRPVGGRQHNDAAFTTKAIHLYQQLVEGAFAFVVAHDGVLTTGAANGVDLIDEYDTRCFFAGLFEQVANAAGAHPHKHFYKIATTQAEERHLGLAGHGFGEQGFAGARRANQQCSLGYLTTEIGVFFRVLEEVDDFHHFHLGFVEAGYIIERDVHPGAFVKELGF